MNRSVSGVGKLHIVVWVIATAMGVLAPESARAAPETTAPSTTAPSTTAPSTTTSNATAPNTPAGTVLTAWLDASNSGDRAQVQAFKDRYLFPASVDQVLANRAASGGFELMSIEESTARSLSALIRTKANDQRAKLVLLVSAADPPTIENIRLTPVRQAPPEAVPVARTTESEALSSLRAHADELAKRNEFSGAMLVARHGKVLLEGAWGMADRDAGKPVTVDTQFNLGSMNKMFTAVAILQLAEAGKVSLDATLGTYLPDYPNRDVAEKVTLRELLNHTGGTGDFFTAEFLANRQSFKGIADYLEFFGSRGLDHEPGKEFRYSNYGFILLGAIIERVSGTSYYDYVEKRIFMPAGMRSTASLARPTKPSRQAIGYTQSSGRWADNSDTLPYRGASAGGGYSTVGDLLKFAQALEAGKLISRKSLQEATQLQTSQVISERRYGYGFVPEGDGPLHSYGHGGGAPGVNGGLRIYPDLGVVVVCLSNLGPPAAERMISFYTQRMPAAP